MHPGDSLGRPQQERAGPLRRPPPDSAESGWLPTLSRLADRPGVLLSGSDAASEFLSRYREAIPADLVSYEGSDSAHLALMDKDTLFRLAATAGVLVPRTVRVDQADDLDRLQAFAGPWVVKPVIGHQGRQAGNFSTRFLTDEAEMRRHVGAALVVGIPMLISEAVPGPTTALEGAIALRTADGARPLEAGRRKLRDYDHGVGSLVESFPATEAIDQARRSRPAATSASRPRRSSDTARPVASTSSRSTSGFPSTSGSTTPRAQTRHGGSTPRSPGFRWANSPRPGQAARCGCRSTTFTSCASSAGASASGDAARPLVAAGDARLRCPELARPGAGSRARARGVRPPPPPPAVTYRSSRPAGRRPAGC